MLIMGRGVEPFAEQRHRVVAAAQKTAGAGVQDHAVEVDNGHLIATAPSTGIDDHGFLERPAYVGRRYRKPVEATGQSKGCGKDDPSSHDWVPSSGPGTIGVAAR